MDISCFTINTEHVYLFYRRPSDSISLEKFPKCLINLHFHSSVVKLRLDIPFFQSRNLILLINYLHLSIISRWYGIWYMVNMVCNDDYTHISYKEIPRTQFCIYDLLLLSPLVKRKVVMLGVVLWSKYLQLFCTFSIDLTSKSRKMWKIDGFIPALDVFLFSDAILIVLPDMRHLMSGAGEREEGTPNDVMTRQ